MSRTAQAEQITQQFEALNNEVIAIVEGTTDEQWRQVTGSEQWPVAVVAHHIGEVNQAFARIVEKLADGATYSPSISIEEINRRNARHAQDYASVSKPEVLDLLQASGTAVARQIRRIGDDQLGRVAGTFGGNELSVAQVLEYVVIGHTLEHLNSLRATLSS